MKWFNNLKVSSKVLLSCSVFMIIILGLAGNTYLTLESADTSFNNFYNDKFIASVELSNIQNALTQLRVNMIIQINAAKRKDTNEVQRIAEVNKSIAEDYRKNMESFSKKTMTAEIKKLVEDFMKTSSATAEYRPKIVEAISKGNIVDAENNLELWVAGYNNAKKISDGLIAQLIKEGKDLQVKQNRETARTNMLLLIILIAALGIGAVITAVLSRSVSGPVNKGLAFAKMIAEGNFLERMDIDQKDELGQLAKALNTSADNLERLISEIISSSQNLVTAVEEIARGNENLSQRTSEQASSLEEIAATVEEANASTRQNAGNANEANNLAEASSKLATEGGHIVEQAVQSISEINNSSKKISEIINMINEIAFQTNLLALNAAVEAARAGEQGRGFAVVAGEVRNLAQRSALASKEINTLIKNSIDQIDDGTALVIKSGEALKEIITSVNQVKRINAEIAAASDEQSRGIEQITTAVTEMDSMTQQNAALVEETASASEEMSNQAQELLAMVKQFKIRESDAMTSKHKNIQIHTLKTKDASEKPVKKTHDQAPGKYNPENEGYEKF